MPEFKYEDHMQTSFYCPIPLVEDMRAYIKEAEAATGQRVFQNEFIRDAIFNYLQHLNYYSENVIRARLTAEIPYSKEKKRVFPFRVHQPTWEILDKMLAGLFGRNKKGDSKKSEFVMRAIDWHIKNLRQKDKDRTLGEMHEGIDKKSS